ncbi:hypothetical protein IB229_02515 [Pseudomonas sp. PDM14]|uniref:hypothetical protein n=1 Tax=Pseudomonas sp. PDM14 TaxID=2769288 RepID=UPI00177E1044|nr:hypothetical protein [Pseudomonas sp. PDM14]MBD9481829.1 hypothetical protein [Pseudomonas sp. PDM14]
MREEKSFPALSITNPNKAWVFEQIDALTKEWVEWNAFCQNIEDSPDFNPKTCSEAIKDGYENIRKHEILREKTLVLLRNHFSGAEFVLNNWKPHPHEDNCSRLKDKVPYWIHRLEIIKASMNYVIVPESYWKEQGKEFLKVLSKSTAESAVDVAASFLKNPLGK